MPLKPRAGLRAGLLAALCTLFVAVAGSQGPAKFRSDDPLAREPETQNAANVAEWDIDLFIDLAINLFGRPGDPATGVRARNINTIDEVPDSNWFTNRILARPVSIEEAARGPQTGTGPAPGKWTITAAKEAGFAPGFTVRDPAGETWFVSFDADGHPEAATGALIAANKIFWTLGYWQVDQVLTSIRPDQVAIGEGATVKVPSGKRRQMRQDDVDAVWKRAHRSADGSYRAVAGRRLPGKTLGGFKYYGTRPDDPNDIVPHEHRRELRALRVFGAWTNLVDMKAGNTLDVLIEEKGRSVVRHYLQDVGSTFGSGANGPHEYDEGWEHLFEGDPVLKRLVSLGFYLRPWQTADYNETDAVGRFEGDEFDPWTWRPRVPTAAYRHAQPDDLFWAARRVMAFSNDMIRAIVDSGRFTNPNDAREISNVLIKRRDKIGAAFLLAVTPLVDLQLSADGRISFQNAAVRAGVAQAPAGGYRLNWSRFDNATGMNSPIGESTIAAGDCGAAPAALPSNAGAFVRVEISATAPPSRTWKPLQAFFRRTGSGWQLVGLER